MSVKVKLFHILFFLKILASFDLKKFIQVKRLLSSLKIPAGCKEASERATLESYKQVVEMKKNNALLPLLEGSLRVRSKRLFIFGSGGSINSYTNSEWAVIDNSDSWAVNLSLLINRPMSVYFPQLGVNEAERMVISEVIDSIPYDDEIFFKKSSFVLRGDWINKGWWRDSDFLSSLANTAGREGRVFLCPEIFIDSSVSDVYGVSKSILKHRQPMMVDGCVFFPKLCNPINGLVILAAQLGYKEIVLCGVDLVGTEHFYDSKEYQVKFPSLKKIKNTSAKARNRFNASKGAPRDEQLIDIGAAIAEETGAKLMVAKKFGALQDRLPVFFDR